MKAKYPAVCYACGKPIVVGVDEYLPDQGRSIHQDCRRPSDEDQIALAERLGYKPHTDRAGLLRNSATDTL